MWHEIHRYKYKHRFFDRWFVPVIVGIITMSFALFLCTALAETRKVFLHLLPIPIIIGVIVITRMVWPSFTKPNAIAKKDNFEEYMLEHQNMGESVFADLVKKGEAHCPYCQKWLTQKSLIYQCMVSPRKGIKPSQKYRWLKTSAVNIEESSLAFPPTECVSSLNRIESTAILEENIGVCEHPTKPSHFPDKHVVTKDIIKHIERTG